MHVLLQFAYDYTKLHAFVESLRLPNRYVCECAVALSRWVTIPTNTEAQNYDLRASSDSWTPSPHHGTLFVILCTFADLLLIHENRHNCTANAVRN